MIRVLAVLLVFANVGVFAWSQWVARPMPAPGAATAQQAPRLRLASEAAGTAGRARAASGCMSLGPFHDLTEAARASTSLRASGLVPRQRAAEGPVWDGYWVSLVGTGAPEEAQKIIERLRRFGIADAYVVPEAGADGTISLGLYSDRARALRRVDDVRALGYAPLVQERTRTGTVYWIDVELAPGRQLDPATFQGDAGRIVRLEVRPCDAAGAASTPVPDAGVPSGTPG
jgi:hypothetical protein